MPFVRMGKFEQGLYVQTLANLQRLASAQTDKTVLSLIQTMISQARYPRRRRKS